jgi:metacaspase-1
MKYVFIVLLLGYARFFYAQPQRISLQIGVSQYAPNTGWQSIHGGNDLDVLKPIMQQQGFEVIQLRDGEATLKGIRDVFQLLEAQISAGSMVHLHFSLHGQQIPDDNNDEFDGLDEALVPYDAPSTPENGYHAERHLRDDELFLMLQRIQNKIGSNGLVWITLDACHSGTATRGWGSFRGTNAPFGKNSFKQKLIDPVLIDPLGNKGAAFEKNDPNVIIFSATTAHEINREYLSPNGKAYGPLSYALAQCFLEDSQITSFEALFARIRQKMALFTPTQTPQLEGNQYLKLWVSGQHANPSFFPILKIWDAQTMVVGAGYLHGLYQEAPVAIYAQNREQVIAKGRVVSLGIQDAEIILDQAVDPQTLANAVVHLEGSKKLLGAVRVQISTDEVLKTALQKLIKNESGMMETIDHPDLVIHLNKNNQYAISSADGREILSIDENSLFNKAEYLFTKGLIPFSRARLIRQLELDELGDVIQVVFHTNVGGVFCPIQNIDAFKIGEQFRIELINQGNKNFFFNILDVSPNDQIVVINPQLNINSQPGDWIIKANERKILEPTWRFTAPEGMEVLKFIISNKPINLQEFFTENRSSSRNLEAFFYQNSAIDITRLQTDVTIKTIVFKIEK